MPSRRTDDPAPRTVRLSALARRLLAELAARLSMTEGPITQTQVLERAIRELARKLKMN